MVPAAVLTQSKPVPITAVRPVSTDVPKKSVTKPKQVKPIVTKPNSPKRRHIRLQLLMLLRDKGVIDSGCSRHMTGTMSYLSNFEELNGGYVAFGGNPKGGKISGKGKIKIGKFDFDDVYFVKELKFNLFSVSQMYDKKNSVLFTDTECLVLSPNFRLPNESQVLLRVPRENNMYNVNLKNIVPSGDLTCLFAKATIDESNLWHRRLHMDLFEPTFVKSPNKKSYCLVVTDDYSRFTWVFFLANKDETSPILETFITGLENQLSLKGIKREFSVPRTPQQNGIVERKNRTLIEAARTMLVDSLLPIPFWAEAVNTACYVKNRVLVTKPHNKTPYELLHGRPLSIGFMRPFGCLVTIFNTLDSLGKFNRKVDEGFLVGYSVNNKAFRVFNSRTRIVQETLHVNFLENKPNVAGSGPTWLFNIDSLTKTMIYQPVTAGNQSNPSAGFQDKFDAEKAGEESDQQYVLFPVWSSGSINPQNTDGDAAFDGKKPESKVNVSPSSSAHINEVNAAGTLVLTDGKISPNSTNTFSVAEADFNNLEKSIIVSPILTTRVHKDHHVTQVIGDLSSVTQTMSMTRVAKDQGGLSQMFNDDFHTWFEDPDHPDKVYKVVKALYGLHQAPRACMWYPKDSPFDLVAYSDSDYASASLDRKYTTGGCQFLRCRLISWQCKKKTVVATSSIKVEYVAAAS
uniref:Integrase catalytic domain-containing protein n=1 Tax=Tanacetum cinerariifolium TaxID=118510 RepID=A0A699HFF3_TANCI|nr:hypothetical protein [Tanacetum cinerariifolium]